MNVVQVNETSAKIQWNHSAACFEDCAITFNLTWTPSHQLQIDHESVETNARVHCITSLNPGTAYKATLTALCKEQSQVTMVSKTVAIAFSTLSGVYTTQTHLSIAFIHYMHN